MADYNYSGSIFTREGQIKFMALFGIGLIIILAVFFSMGNSNTSSSTDTGLSVTTGINTVGDYLVITTKATNSDSSTVEKGISIYVEDGIGAQHFVDKVYITLNPGETGTAKSSIKKDEVGPPPYTVIAE